MQTTLDKFYKNCYLPRFVINTRKHQFLSEALCVGVLPTLRLMFTFDVSNSGNSTAFLFMFAFHIFSGVRSTSLRRDRQNCIVKDTVNAYVILVEKYNGELLQITSFWFATENSDWHPLATYLRSCNSRDVGIPPRCKLNLRPFGNLRSVEWYRGADKSVVRLGRKQANVSVRISFGALPCIKIKLDDSSRLDVVEIARVPDMLPSLFPSWSN